MIFLLPIYGNVWFFYKNYQNALIIFDTIFALLSVWIWFGVPKKLAFWFGFFVGLGLFYWVGLSFRFSPFPFLIPLIMFFVALIYGFIFYFLLFFTSSFYRILTLMLMSYIHPFGFDWLKVDAFFSYSIFSVDKLSFFCIITGVWAFVYFKRFYKILGICFLFLALDWGGIKGKITLPSGIEVITTNINQNLKWQSENLNNIIWLNIDSINKAILSGKKMIIFPETTFPFILNKSFLMPELLTLSKKITIITGALREEEGQIYNSTYIFQNGHFTYIDKVVLAPFGEKIPLPDFLAKPFYKIFFGEEYSLSEGKKPGNFTIDNDVFRSAICYEGTSEIMYQDKPKYLILISNNGWFTPSIEPIVQRMLIKYYARIYDTIVIHSINQSPSYIISPFILGDENL
ncbi:apolipoprotein N-acyltransferase [Helicobacter sp. 13S00477-4]|nr:apolipoprotein N-acyltransferase [Helicobacter sp. 13S00477-4]